MPRDLLCFERLEKATIWNGPAVCGIHEFGSEEIMVKKILWGGVLAALVSASLLSGRLFSQPGPPAGRGFGRGRDAGHRADMVLFHFLLDNRRQITRKVTKLPNGVETLTESAVPAIAQKIQAHVASMYKRLEHGRPIHARDPLFAEIFRNKDKIKMKLEKTKAGVKVAETSDDAYVVRLIQAHAEVVNQFLKNGRLEMRKNHAVPAKP